MLFLVATACSSAGDDKPNEGKADGHAFRFTSAGGKATVEGTIERTETDGTVTFADGTKPAVTDPPARRWTCWAPT